MIGIIEELYEAIEDEYKKEYDCACGCGAFVCEENMLCFECEAESRKVNVMIRYLEEQNCEEEFYIEWLYDTELVRSSHELLVIAKKMYDKWLELDRETATNELISFVLDDVYYYEDWFVEYTKKGEN